MRLPVAIDAPRGATPIPARIGRASEPAAAVVLVGAVAIGVAFLVDLSPVAGLAIPAAVAGAIVCARYPTAAILGIFVLTGLSGTLVAGVLTGNHSLPARGLSDALLIGLWVGVLWKFLTQRDRPLWLWPGLVAPGLYLALTAFEVFAGGNVSAGVESFRLSAWPMMAFLMVALAPWEQRMFVRMARAALVAALLIGLYNLYRWVVGPTPGELAVARAALPGVPRHIGLRFFGSFVTPQNLAGWCATILPFALTLAVVWKGRWRLIATGVVALVAFALVASNVLTGIFAAIAGIATAIMLYGMARAFPGGRRLAASLVAVFAIVVIGGGAYGIAVSGSETSKSKLQNLLDPTGDPTFQTRLDRWDVAFSEVSKHPFGTGLGSVGIVGKHQPATSTTLSPNFDSSYLKIALEQGFVVMAIFVIALLVLLFGLAARAIATADPTAAAFGIAACGTLVAMMVLFFAGFYSEHLQTISGWLLIGFGVAQFTAPRIPRAAAGGAGTPGVDEVAARST